MKFLVLASLLVAAVSATSPVGLEVFQSFKTEHGKTYKNQVEEAKRFAIFSLNVRQIEEHNALFKQGLVSYEKGINQFTDLTHEEFVGLLTLQVANKPILNTTEYVRTGAAVPTSIDWRTQGQVTEVKDQGKCGSCWAFSLTGSIEAAYYRKTEKLVSLSEQQLVDCATSINYGCDGGYIYQNFPYIEKRGLQSEASYPYTGTDGRCAYDSSKVVTKVSSYVTNFCDEDVLLEAVGSIGPVSISMDASYLSDYKSGIYTDPRCLTYGLNHGVLMVGYGSENGTDYWIVKNSWGASWGEEGYFKILRGVNQCGVAVETVYPII